MSAPNRDDALRRAFQDLPATSRPRDDCPEPELLWDALAGSLSPAEQRRIVDHTAECRLCAHAWRLGYEMRSGVREANRETPPVRSRRWPLAVAASVLLAALVAVPLYFSPPPSNLRQPPRAEIVSALSEEIALSPAGFELRWKGPPEAIYSVVVTTEDLRVVMRRTQLRVPELRVPAEALESLPPGATLLWQVEASLEDGTQLSSATFRARLSEEP